MKIVLIQFDLVMGSRILLSLLRQKGYDVKSLQINIRYIDLLSPQDLDLIYEYVGDAPVEEIIDAFLFCINGIEKHHKIDLKHVALHPYLTGFNKWTKTVGEVGKKVLFRSYHQPYG